MKAVGLTAVFGITLLFFEISVALDGPNVCIKNASIASTELSVGSLLKECCEGYEEIDNRCLPACDKCATNEKCVAPNVCQCQGVVAKDEDKTSCEIRGKNNETGASDQCVRERHYCRKKKCCEPLKCDRKSRRCVKNDDKVKDYDHKNKCAKEKHSCKNKKCCSHLKCDLDSHKCVKNDTLEDYPKCAVENHSCKKKKCCDPLNCDRKSRRCVKNDTLDDHDDQKCAAENHYCRKKKCCEPFECDRKSRRCLKNDTLDDFDDQKCAAENHSCKKKKCCDPLKCDRKSRHCVKYDDAFEARDYKKCAAENHSCKKKKCCDTFKCDRKSRRCIRNDDFEKSTFMDTFDEDCVGTMEDC